MADVEAHRREPARREPDTNGVLRYKVQELERQVDAVERKIDRLVMAAVVAVFTFSGAILLLSVNLLILRKG